MGIKGSNRAYQRKAIEQFEAALAIYVELDDRTGQALMLQHLSHCYMALRQFAKAAELLEQALAIPRSCPSLPAYKAVFTNECAPETYAVRPRNVSMRRVRVLHPYRVPEASAFCWGAVPCPFSPTGLAPWVLARMAHIRSMDYPVMQQQMLDFVEMVIDLSAQQRRKKRACMHIDSPKPALWSLFQVARECRQSVEFWTIFSKVLEFFSDPSQ